jgi:hypothetical protein
MGGDSYDSEDLVRAAEKTGGKVYYTTHAGVGMSSASRAIRRFDAYFQAAYGRPPQNAFAALGYDALDLVAMAIRKTDSVDPAKIRDALQATRHFPGVTGTLSYAGDERVPHKKVTVVCVGRRPVVVGQFTPGTLTARRRDGRRTTTPATANPWTRGGPARPAGPIRSVSCGRRSPGSREAGRWTPGRRPRRSWRRP